MYEEFLAFIEAIRNGEIDFASEIYTKERQAEIIKKWLDQWREQHGN